MKDGICWNIHFCLFYLFNSVYGGGRGSGNKKPKQKKSENKRIIKSRGGVKSFVPAAREFDTFGWDKRKKLTWKISLLEWIGVTLWVEQLRWQCLLWRIQDAASHLDLVWIKQMFLTSSSGHTWNLKVSVRESKKVGTISKFLLLFFFAQLIRDAVKNYLADFFR